MAEGDPHLHFDVVTGQLSLESPDGKHRQILCRLDKTGTVWVFYKYTGKEKPVTLTEIIKALRA